MESGSDYRQKLFGDFGENVAAEYYISRGYAIRERKWRRNRLEIDIIAQRDAVMVFVEVKARSGKDGDPVEAVTLDKMKRMSRGADIYLKMQEGDFEYRFDIAAVTGDMDNYKLEVIEDAFVSPLRG